MKDGNIFVGLNSRLKPAVEFRTYRRNLPHFELPGSLYFLSFRTADRLTLSDSAKDIVLSSFHFHDKKKYHLHACVIMDDHAHCILQPIDVMKKAQAGTPVPPRPEIPMQPHEYHSLAQITHSIKSYSSNRIQKLLNRKSRIWQDENYDRIIRDEKEYLKKMNYIVNNPVKAGFVEEFEDYKWLFVAVID